MGQTTIVTDPLWSPIWRPPLLVSGRGGGATTSPQTDSGEEKGGAYLTPIFFPLYLLLLSGVVPCQVESSLWRNFQEFPQLAGPASVGLLTHTLCTSPRECLDAAVCVICKITLVPGAFCRHISFASLWASLSVVGFQVGVRDVC